MLGLAGASGDVAASEAASLRPGDRDLLHRNSSHRLRSARSLAGLTDFRRGRYTHRFLFRGLGNQ